jgi:hypothetical protein
MKKPKFIYHGSRKKIDWLKPRKPNDTHPDHCIKAVYATSNKLQAISHGISSKNSRCFGERGNHVACFVSGWPNKKTHKYSYLHVLDSKDFEHNIRNEWIAKKEVRPIRIEAYKIEDLDMLWRKSSEEELNEFLKDRPSWKIPKKENLEKKKLLKKNPLRAYKIWNIMINE